MGEDDPVQKMYKDNIYHSKRWLDIPYLKYWHSPGRQTTFSHIKLLDPGAIPECPEFLTKTGLDRTLVVGPLVIMMYGTKAWICDALSGCSDLIVLKIEMCRHLGGIPTDILIRRIGHGADISIFAYSLQRNPRWLRVPSEIVIFLWPGSWTTLPEIDKDRE